MMFCPRCGEKLTNTRTGLWCLKGDMQLSENLAARLNDCFILEKDAPKRFRFSFVVGGNWFCPKDGVKTVEKDGFIECAECNSSLNEFIFALIERHLHK
jgi:hypothetical protein